MKNPYPKKIIGILLLIIIHSSILAQRGFFLMGGMEFNGSESNYKFQQNGSKLQKNWIAYERGGDGDADDSFANVAHGNGMKASFSLNLNYIFLRHFSIAIGLRVFNESVIVNDKDFIVRNKMKGTKYMDMPAGTRMNGGSFNIRELYINPSITGCYIFNTRETATGPFIAFGLGSNKFISNSSQVVTSYYHPESHEFLQLKTNFLKTFNNRYLEFGYLMCADNDIDYTRPGLKFASRESVASIALRYSFVRNTVEADYANSINGKIQYTDHLSASNSNISLVFKYGGGIFANAVDKQYERHYHNKNIVKNTSEKEEPEIKKEIFYIPKKVRGRKISFKKEIVVKDSNITIYVWDHGRYDKDVISVNANGNWILENDTLTLVRKAIQINMREGLNYLTFFAISEGTEKPCTLSVIIDDGVTQQQITINSDMKNSESIKIRYIP